MKAARRQRQLERRMQEEQRAAIARAQAPPSILDFGISKAISGFLWPEAAAAAAVASGGEKKDNEDESGEHGVTNIVPGERAGGQPPEMSAGADDSGRQIQENL